MPRKYGSASADEMAARMRDAGYPDWEIAEELDMAQKLTAERAAYTHALHETGQFIPGDSIDQVGRPNIERAAEQYRSSIENTISAMTEKERTMAFENGYTIDIAKQTGSRESVRKFPRKSDGNIRAEVTLPGNTIIPLADGQEFDASFHKLYIAGSQVKETEKGYQISFPGQREDGTIPEVTVRREQGHWEHPEAEGKERGEWLVDSVSEQKVSVDALAEAVSNRAPNYINVSIPRTIKEQPNLHYFTHEGKELASMKLPPHAQVVDTQGIAQDGAFFELVVPATAVKSYDNDPNYYTVGFPRANRDGEPWEVLMTREEGAWENPEAATPEERGEWVSTGRSEIRCTAESFKVGMDAYREEVKAYAASQQAEAPAKEKAKAKEQDHASTISIPKPKTQATDKTSVSEDAVIAGLAASAVTMAKPTVEKSRSI